MDVKCYNDVENLTIEIIVLDYDVIVMVIQLYTMKQKNQINILLNRRVDTQKR